MENYKEKLQMANKYRGKFSASIFYKMHIQAQANVHHETGKIFKFC